MMPFAHPTPPYVNRGGEHGPPPNAEGGNYRPPLRQEVRRRPPLDPKRGDGDNSPLDDGRGTRRKSRPPLHPGGGGGGPPLPLGGDGNSSPDDSDDDQGTLHKEEVVMVEDHLHPWVVAVVVALLAHQEGEDHLALKGPLDPEGPVGMWDPQVP